MAKRIRRSKSNKKSAVDKQIDQLKKASGGNVSDDLDALLDAIRNEEESDDNFLDVDNLLKELEKSRKRDAQEKKKRQQETKKAVDAVRKNLKEKKKESKQEDIDPRILQLLGLEDYEAELDYDEYKTLIKEKMASDRMGGGKEEREGDNELLKNEFRRAQKQSGSFSVKSKRTIKTSNFVGRKPRSSTPSAGKTVLKNLLPPSKTNDVKSEIEEDRQEELVPLSRTLSNIENNLESILKLDEQRQKKEEQTAKRIRSQEQRQKRETREAKLEDTDKDTSKAVEKKIKPISNVFDIIGNFFKNILLGSLVTFLIDIVNDPGKLVRPIYDFVNMLIDVGNNIIGFVNDVVLVPFNFIIDRFNDAFDMFENTINSLTNILPGLDPINLPTIPKISIPDIKKLEYPEWAVQKQEGGGEVVNARDISMIDGGAIDTNTGIRIQGLGKDTQLIAAQPGEVMMSKRAVDLYGGMNLLAANAAAGGNNKPNFGKILGYAGGGMIGGGSLLDFIGSGEGGYNSMNQGTIGDRIVGSTHNAMKKIGKNLTDMTIGEIMDRQKYLMNKANPQISDYGIFAAGKYQIIPPVMPEAVKYAGLSRNDMFSPANQDKLGTALIMQKRPKVGAFLRGESNDLKGAMKELSLEFASIPDPDTGMSAYGSGNRTAHTVAQVEQILKSSRTQIMGGKPLSSSAPSAEIAKSQSSSSTMSGRVQPYGSSGGGTTVLPIPTGATQQSSGSIGSQQRVPGFSAEDTNNFDLIVVKSIYNIVG